MDDIITSPVQLEVEVRFWVGWFVFMFVYTQCWLGTGPYIRRPPKYSIHLTRRYAPTPFLQALLDELGFAHEAEVELGPYTLDMLVQEAAAKKPPVVIEVREAYARSSLLLSSHRALTPSIKYT